MLSEQKTLHGQAYITTKGEKRQTDIQTDRQADRQAYR